MSNPVTIKVTEMKNVDVQFISLVKRSASRIPFRVLKTAEESNMSINLNGLFTRAKKTAEPVAPVVVGIVIPSTSNIEDAISKVEKMGLTVLKKDTETSKDVVVLVVKEDYNQETTHTIKMSDDVAVLVETAKKSFYGWPEGTSFTENMSQAGFFPGLRIASSTLIETIENQLYGSEELPLEAVTKCLDEYKTYVLALAKGIPESAFKMQSLTIEAAKEEEVVETVEKEEVPATDSKDEATPVAKTGEEATSEEAATEVVKKGETDGEVVLGTTQEDALEAFKQVLLDAIKETTTKLDAISDKVDSAVATSEEAITLAKKNDEALENVVVNTDEGVETAPDLKVVKSGVFDSAFELKGYTD